MNTITGSENEIQLTLEVELVELNLGIDKKIVKEGCWGPSPDDDMNQC